MEKRQSLDSESTGRGKGRIILEYDLTQNVRLVVEIGGKASVKVSNGTVSVTVPESIIIEDVESSLLAESVASLLLIKPSQVRGDQNGIDVLTQKYVKRLVCEEAKKLSKKLGMLLDHTYVADLALIAMRISKLFRLHLWLRNLYNKLFVEKPYVDYVRTLIGKTLGLQQRWISLPKLLNNCRDEAKRGVAQYFKRAEELARVAMDALSIQWVQVIQTDVLMQGFSTKPVPILQDPMLLVRLDSAKIATKLLSFEDQLYAITGVTRMLRRKRRSIVRSARILEGEHGFKPAVIKYYRSTSSAKWVAVYLAALHISKPRTKPLSRLQAEYHYNRELRRLGFKVPEPLLVDVRRAIAAYTYIEGQNLVDILKENSIPREYYEYGTLLAKLHSENIVLWDSNPTNIIKASDGLYIVDLEQARKSSRLEEKALDIAIAVYYTIPYNINGVAERGELLAKGYIDGGGDPKVVLEASKYKYASPFSIVSPLAVLEKVRRRMAHVAYRSL
jgi:Kae1-associated kinase Bud32